MWLTTREEISKSAFWYEWSRNCPTIHFDIKKLAEKIRMTNIFVLKPDCSNVIYEFRFFSYLMCISPIGVKD